MSAFKEGVPSMEPDFITKKLKNIRARQVKNSPDITQRPVPINYVMIDIKNRAVWMCDTKNEYAPWYVMLRGYAKGMKSYRKVTLRSNSEVIALIYTLTLNKYLIDNKVTSFDIRDGLKSLDVTFNNNDVSSIYARIQVLGKEPFSNTVIIKHPGNMFPRARRMDKHIAGILGEVRLVEKLERIRLRINTRMGKLLVPINDKEAMSKRAKFKLFTVDNEWNHGKNNTTKGVDMPF